MQRSVSSRRMAAWAAGALLGSACSRERSAGESDTTQAAAFVVAQRIPAPRAAASIAEARCAKQLRCDAVGAEDPHGRRECRTRLAAEAYADLNGDECAAGVDERALGECLQEIAEQGCNDPLDAVGQVAACGSSDLCRALPD